MSSKTDLFDDQDPAEKIDAAQRRYNKSEKGRVAHKKHQQSEKGKGTASRYAKSEKGKLSKEKYRHSPKGKAFQNKKNENEKMLRRAHKWLKDNPGKTFNDFLKLQKESEELNDNSKG